ncbi:hypothetical protein V1509DRAFT_621797 [Lipomyces kononenkoae]
MVALYILAYISSYVLLWTPAFVRIVVVWIRLFFHLVFMYFYTSCYWLNGLVAFALTIVFLVASTELSFPSLVHPYPGHFRGTYRWCSRATSLNAYGIIALAVQ